MIKSKKNIFNKSEENENLENNASSDTDNAEGSENIDANSNESIETAASGEGAPEEQNNESELDKKVKEIETLTDTMKRRQADFENYKKRTIKLQEEQKKLAIKDFALDVININDD